MTLISLILSVLQATSHGPKDGDMITYLGEDACIRPSDLEDEGLLPVASTVDSYPTR